MKIYLNVHYDDRIEAKSMGALWDPSNKKWFTTDSNNELILKFGIKEKPQLVGGNISRISKIINTYYFDEFYNLFPYDCTMTEIQKMPKINKSLHVIYPQLSGCFVDYLIRRIICEIIDKPFNDVRAEMITSRSVILDDFDNYCDDECEKWVESDFTKCRHTTDKQNFREEIKQSYHNCKTLSINSQNIIRDILLTACCHSLFFGQLDFNKTKLFLKCIDTNKNIKFVSNLYTFLQKYLQLKNRKNDSIVCNPCVGTAKISGDGDLIIDDIFIDFKTTKFKYTKEDIIQLLAYSGMKYNKDKQLIQKIQVWNCYLGSIYELDISMWDECERIKFIKFLAKDNRETELSYDLESIDETESVYTTNPTTIPIIKPPKSKELLESEKRALDRSRCRIQGNFNDTPE